MHKRSRTQTGTKGHRNSVIIRSLVTFLTLVYRHLISPRRKGDHRGQEAMQCLSRGQEYKSRPVEIFRSRLITEMCAGKLELYRPKTIHSTRLVFSRYCCAKLSPTNTEALGLVPLLLFVRIIQTPVLRPRDSSTRLQVSLQPGRCRILAVGEHKSVWLSRMIRCGE